jgi:hypothetical protein
MTKRFVISVDNVNAQQQDVISNWLRSTHLGFWHQLSHVWLIVDLGDVYTVGTMREQIARLIPGVAMIVVGVERPTDWAGFGLTQQFDWMRKVWEVA